MAGFGVVPVSALTRGISLSTGLIGMAASRASRIAAYMTTVGPSHLDEEEREVHKAFVKAAGGPHAKANPELAENMTGLKFSNMEEKLDPSLEKKVVGTEEEFEVLQAFKHSVEEGKGHDASRDNSHL